MSDMGEVFNTWKKAKKQRRELLGVPCPDCTVKLPKADPKILMPNQRCWCGYRDPRVRKTQTKELTLKQYSEGE